MTPWLRLLRWGWVLAAVTVVGCGGGVRYGAGSSYAGPAAVFPSRAPSIGPAAVSPSGAPSAGASPSVSGGERRRAGSPAGEGRVRPGRPVEPGAEVPSTAPAATAATRPADAQTAGSAPSVPAGEPVRQAGGGAEPVLRILPLGGGLVLIGLGLGLAFVGLRVRRGAG
ncbi:hypothetical protein [Streptomyces sp. NPDC006997]|uniref:hypothetical protein n=1 Tax=Streptomyces sp. NPDC006997 TaxID=3155356 RepID=UPI00340F1BE9